MSDVDLPSATISKARLSPAARIGLLALAAAALFAIAQATGASEWVTVANVRALVQEAGVLALLAIALLFTIGHLLHVPGLLLVGVTVVACGRMQGAAVAFASGLIATSVTFVVVRALGGSALAEVERPWVRRVLAHLDHRPIATVAVLRVLGFLAPWLTYTLALTSVRFRDQLLGSCVGLLPQLALATWAFDRMAAGGG